jgi:pimeloyl-ACP methyl ester carboxylesterase
MTLELGTREPGTLEPGTLELEIRSTGTGPAVLWIHGYTLDSSLWADLWQLLPGYRHIGVDLPGHGSSGPFPAGLTLPGLAMELARLARAEDAHRVVALSFGTIAALQLAIDAPDLVRRLVVGAPGIGGRYADGVAERYQQLALLRRLAGPGELMADLWMSSPPDLFRGTERHPVLRKRVKEVVMRHDWAELMNGRLRLLAGHAQVPALGQITADTLVIIGDEDMPAYHDNTRTLCGAVPRCRSHPVPAAGHLVLLERPAEVAAIIARQLI